MIRSKTICQPTKVAQAYWGGVRGVKKGWFSPTFGVRRDKGFLGDRRFPAKEEG